MGRGWFRYDACAHIISHNHRYLPAHDNTVVQQQHCSKLPFSTVKNHPPDWDFLRHFPEFTTWGHRAKKTNLPNLFLGRKEEACLSACWNVSLYTLYDSSFWCHFQQIKLNSPARIHILSNIGITHHGTPSSTASAHHREFHQGDCSKRSSASASNWHKPDGSDVKHPHKKQPNPSGWYTTKINKHQN